MPQLFRKLSVVKLVFCALLIGKGSYSAVKLVLCVLLIGREVAYLLNTFAHPVENILIGD